jgi:hypothetical protein
MPRSDSKKAPEIRVRVTDVDRLLHLTEAQLKVWLYYKRREGKDGKAWGKASTIAAACNFTKPTSANTVKNTRAWLVKNGWLRPNGKSKFWLPMFLAVIPRLPQGPSVDYPEVPTMKDSARAATMKDSAADAAVGEVSKEVSEDGAARPSAGTEEKEKTQTLYWSEMHKREFSAEESALAGQYLYELFRRQLPDEANSVLMAEIALDFQARYPDPKAGNGPGVVTVAQCHTVRKVADYLAWNRKHKKGGMVHATVAEFHKAWFSDNPRSARNQWEDHPADCKLCAKAKADSAGSVDNDGDDFAPQKPRDLANLPAYRRESGRREILKGNV